MGGYRQRVPGFTVCLIGGFAALVLLGTGCASPESRIRKHPEMFGSFSETVREDVRRGIVKLGYTKDMVFIAAGRPDMVRTRLAAGGESETWIYLGYRWAYDDSVRCWYPYARYGGSPGWYDYPHFGHRRVPYDRLVLQFDGDSLVAVERTEE